MMSNLLTPKSTDSLSEWLHYIQNLHYKNIDLSLDRVSFVAKKLDLLDLNAKIILVGGTNGKGTTCRLLESILLANGINVGVFTSPHLLYYTERIRIQGLELLNTDHVEALAFIDKFRDNISLSYFEFITLSALYLFKKSKLDVIILEVGLGGRLDATNIVNPDISVITSISLDHTNMLGTSYNSIATEKSGIFRYGKLAVIGESTRPAVFGNMSNKCGSKLFARSLNWWIDVNSQTSWSWWSRHCMFRYLPIPRIPLDNAATVLATLSCLEFPISEKSIHCCLNSISLMGRFQVFHGQPLVILDVAHNPHAARYLLKCLTQMFIKGRIRAVVGMLSYKDVCGTLSCLRSLVTIWYCASLDAPLTLSPSDLVLHLFGCVTYQFSSIIDAYNQAILDSKMDDCVLVFGSFYSVAPVLNLLNKQN